MHLVIGGGVLVKERSTKSIEGVHKTRRATIVLALD